MTERRRYRRWRLQAKKLWRKARQAPAMGDTQRFLLLSIIIGIFAGLVVVCFHIAIEFFTWNTV